MTPIALVLLSLLLPRDRVHSPHLDPHWDDYKDRHNKTFKYMFLESRRRLNWENNFQLIDKHNAEAASGKHSYRLHDNHLADLDVTQYLRKMVRLRKSRKRRTGEDIITDFNPADHPDVPEELNWTEKGFITPDWNQGRCGSCYAFSIISSIEGQFFKKTGKFLDLSEQQILDCSIREGNLGCGGGSLRNTLRYIKRAGLMSAEDYPYRGKVGTCKYRRKRVVANTTSWAILPPQDETALQIAVAKIGPIAVSLNASPRTFQLYHSGIYDDQRCSADIVNHAVLLVGYTKEAWIIKNWWSKRWGENGYMKLARHKNRCGIANYAAYAFT
ncbi:cathepsin K [Anabrus simplex]|uniref:cathepsin K n=1 Tax=Anabrus simplex TaxID=316456 RepID=UPI0035A33B19